MPSGVNLNTNIDYTKLMQNAYYQQRMANGYGATTGTTQPSFGATETDTYTSTINTTNGCTDGKDDGKIGFWSAVGNTVKGVGKTLVNGVKGMFTNKDGKFSLGKTLASVGTAALCIAFPAVGLVACAVGGVMGAVQVGKGIYNAATADTDAEAKQAWQDVGGGTFTVVTSYFGGKASLGAVKASSTANIAKTGSALDEATTMSQKAVALVKDMGSSTVNRGRTIGQTASAFVKQGKLTKANKKVEGLEKKIADAADDADTTKLQKKLESAKEAKAKAQEAYDTSNGKTNVEKINGKIESRKKQIEAKKQQAAEALENKKTELVAKGKNFKNSKQKVATDANQHSPQAEIYKVGNEQKLSNLEKSQRGQSRTDRFNARGAKADPNRTQTSTTKAGKKAQAQQNAIVKETQTKIANGTSTAPKATKVSLIDKMKGLPDNIKAGLSHKAQKAWDILTTKGKYEAIKELGYEAVYEVLAVVESYSLAEQSV